MEDFLLNNDSIHIIGFMKVKCLFYSQLLNCRNVYYNKVIWRFLETYGMNLRKKNIFSFSNKIYALRSL